MKKRMSIGANTYGIGFGEYPNANRLVHICCGKKNFSVGAPLPLTYCKDRLFTPEQTCVCASCIQLCSRANLCVRNKNMGLTYSRVFICVCIIFLPPKGAKRRLSKRLSLFLSDTWIGFRNIVPVRSIPKIRHKRFSVSR